MDSLKELIEKKINQISIIKEELTNISDINEKTDYYQIIVIWKMKKSKIS